MSFKRWYRKHRVLGTSLLACAAFLALALYGWGVTWEQMGAFFVVTLVLLGGLIGAAAITGWVIARLRHRDD
jgi:hypothetical protein